MKQIEKMVTMQKGSVLSYCNIYGLDRKIVLRKRGHIKNCVIEPDVEIVDGRAWYVKVWRMLFDRQAMY